MSSSENPLPSTAAADSAALEKETSVPVRPKGLFILDPGALQMIYGPDERTEIDAIVDFCGEPQTPASIAANPEILSDVEVIFSGWGAPIMDAAFLAAAPRLRAVFYGAGSIRSFVTEAFWERGIVITSAYAANAVPVAEYALATILLSLKRFWFFAEHARAGRVWSDPKPEVPGAFRSTVGLVSCGMVARRLLELLKAFDLQQIIYCPFLSREEAVELGVKRRSLEDVFRNADVVSLHTPDLPETRGLITGRLFSLMKKGATFINTARGAVVRELEMVEVLQQRPDLTAILDVTHPEPPAPDSPLLSLPNVILTPHIAGSMSGECRRMGRFMIEEFKRFQAGEPLEWQITREQAAKLA
jgi:phosphoglycerate dehydrogenase-like enzyme